MKKLMVIAAVAMAAVAAQAAQFTWKTGASSSTGPVVLPTSVKGSLSAATAYIFENGSQQAVLDAFFAGTFTELTSYDGSTMTTAGKIAAKSSAPFTYGGEGVAATMTAFFAVVQTVGDQSYLFISDTVTAAGAATGSKALSFNAKEAGANLTSFAEGAKKTYGSAGWYTQSVPEPTSGLLLLIGMAGLALRRRRA